MKTRQQYLNKECTHREYYSQFVDAEMVKLVSAYITDARLLNSMDEHLNDIPLIKWDHAQSTTHRMTRLMRECGDCMSNAGAVCILKEAARQRIEQLHKV